MENVDLETYMELCRLNELSCALERHNIIMLPSRTTDDNTYPSEAPMNCKKPHFTISSGICTFIENDRTEVLYRSSQRKTDLALRSE